MGFFNVGSLDRNPIIGTMEFCVTDDYGVGISTELNDAILLTMFPHYVFKMAYNLGEKTQRKFFEIFVNLGAQVQKELAAGTPWTETSRFNVRSAHVFEAPFFRCQPELRRGKLGLYILTPVELIGRVNNDQVEAAGQLTMMAYWNFLADVGPDRESTFRMLLTVMEAICWAVSRHNWRVDKLSVKDTMEILQAILEVSIKRAKSDDTTPRMRSLVAEMELVLAGR